MIERAFDLFVLLKYGLQIAILNEKICIEFARLCWFLCLFVGRSVNRLINRQTDSKKIHRMTVFVELKWEEKKKTNHRSWFDLIRRFSIWFAHNKQRRPPWSMTNNIIFYGLFSEWESRKKTHSKKKRTSLKKWTLVNPPALTFDWIPITKKDWIKNPKQIIQHRLKFTVNL